MDLGYLVFLLHFQVICQSCVPSVEPDYMRQVLESPQLNLVFNSKVRLPLQVLVGFHEVC